MKIFRCQDIGLASFLKLSGAVVIDLVHERDHFLFEFDEQNKCNQLASDFWNKKAVGNIKEYEEAKQTLISMIKNKK